jgi:transglutaminase-like putative cysteine protease
MMPRNTYRQTCLSTQVITLPAPATSMTRTDYFGNQAFHFTIEASHQILEVTASSSIEVGQGSDWPSLNIGNTCQQVRTLLAKPSKPQDLAEKEYTMASPFVALDPLLAQFAAPFFQDERPFLSAVREFNAHIFNEFTFDPSFSTTSTAISDVFAHKKGVCQDFAHLAIASLRSLGFAARYVSGYLETIPPPGTQKLVGSDATHAWFEVYSPGEGWFEFDPTNNSIPAEQHIVTAWGRDYTDVTPLKGVVFGGGTHSLDVSVDVNRA